MLPCDRALAAAGVLLATAGAFAPRPPPAPAGPAPPLRSTVADDAPAAAAPAAEPGARDLLVRAARGEATERTAVWLMRQAGRYMKDFRAYSDV